MKKILLTACLTGFSILSYAQCVVTNSDDNGAGSLRQAIADFNSNAATCATANTVTVQAALAGSVVNLTSELVITNNSSLMKTVNLSGLTLTSTSATTTPEEGVIRINGANNLTLTNIKIDGADKSGISVQSGNTIIIENSEIYNVGRDDFEGMNGDNNVAAWTGVEFKTYPEARGVLHSGIYFKGNINNFTIRNNTVSGNEGNGIRIFQNNGSGTRLIENNKIGVSSNGLAPKGNLGEGVLLEESNRVTVKNNHIAANGNHKLWENDPTINSLTVAQTRLSKEAAVYTSYLLGSGIELRKGGSHIIQGNFIGTNADGSAIETSPDLHDYGNHKIGIYVKASSNNLIGGTVAGQGNIVGGNGYAFENNLTNSSNPSAGEYVYGVLHGIQIHADGGSVENNNVYGNFVGWYNNNCIPNRQDAMSLLGYGNITNLVRNNKIGGGNAGEGNVFTGGEYGVFLQGPEVRSNTILGNTIGQVDGTCTGVNCSPELAGMKIQNGSYGNTIGTDVAPNTISYINGNAIEVDGTDYFGDDGNWVKIPTPFNSKSNNIQSNVMKGNNGGISLENGGNDNYGLNAVRINVPTSKGLNLEGFSKNPTDRIDIYIADTTCGFEVSELCQNTKTYGGTTIPNVQGLKYVTTVYATSDSKFNPGESAFWQYTINPATDGKLTVANAVVTATQKSGAVFTNTSQFNTCADRVSCDPPSTAVITAADGFCPGKSVELTATALTEHQYTWFKDGSKVGGGAGSSNNKFTVTEAGKYTVKIASTIDTVRCALTSPVAKEVSLYETPLKPVIEGKSPVCVNDVEDYTISTNAAKYAWTVTPTITSAGATTESFTITYDETTTARKIELVITDDNGCESAKASKDITVRAVPVLVTADLSATPSSVCVDTDTELTGKTKQTFETSTWSKLSGPGDATVGVIATPTNSATTDITDLSAAGTYVFRYSLKNDGCANAVTADVNVSVKAQPVATSAGVNDTICLGGTATLKGQVPLADQEVLWTGPGTINSPDEQTTTIDDLDADIHTFSYQIKNDVCPLSAKATVLVVVQSPATATIVEPTGSILSINETTTELKANPDPVPANYSGLWSITKGTNGTITSTDKTLPTVEIEDITAFEDTITVCWKLTDKFNACPSTEACVKVVRIDAPIPPKFTKSIICVSDTAAFPQLKGEVPVSPIVSSWVGVNGAKFKLIDAQTIEPIFDKGASTYEYDYVFTNTGVVGNPSGSTRKTIQLDELPTQAIAGNDTALCVDSYTLKANSPKVGVGTWLKGTTSIDRFIDNLIQGDTTIYTWSITNGECAASTDDVQIVRVKDLTVPNLSNDTTICEGSPISIVALNSLKKGETTLWSTKGGISINNPLDNPNLEVSSFDVGENIFVYTISNNVCPDISDSVKVSVDELPTIANAGNDTTLCVDSYILKGNSPSVGSGTWLSGTTPIDSFVNNLVQGDTATYTWSISNGVCPASTDDVDIVRVFNLTIPDLSDDEEICKGESIGVLARNQLGDGETSLWTTKGGADIDTPSENDPKISGLDIGDNIFVYTVSNKVCPDLSDSVKVTVNDLPTLTDVTGDKLICDDDDRQVKYVATGSALVDKFVWILPSGISLVRYEGSRNDILIAESVADTSDQTVIVKALSSAKCASVDSVTIDFSRVSMIKPTIDPGKKSCTGIENQLFVKNTDNNLDYTWTNSADIAMDISKGDTISLLTPLDDYTVTVVASRKDIKCDIKSSALVSVYKIVTGLGLSGLNPDQFINKNGKCEAGDQRFDSITTLRVNVSPSSLDLDDLTFEWKQIVDLDTIPLLDTTNTLSVNYALLTPGKNYTYRVKVGNVNCEGTELEVEDNIDLLEAVKVDYKLSDNTISCVDEKVVFGVRNQGKHDDNVEYTWYHNDFVIETDIDFYYNPFLNKDDTSLTVLQIDKKPEKNDTLLNEAYDFVNYTTYNKLVGGSEIVYDNYRTNGKRGDTIIVVAQPEYCIIYSTSDATKGINLLRDTIMTSDYVFNRPKAVATAFDMNTLERTATVNMNNIWSGAYVLENDELIIDKVEDRFALYDATDMEGLTLDTLIRNWFVVDENGDYSQQQILSNKDIVAYPIPENRPEVVTYMLKRSNGVCSDSDFVDVKINYLPWPPNAFSPNGDGKFDKFEITNVDKYPGTTVTIFNRWGTEVVKIKEYHLKENWWDGTKGGEALPTGGYFYIIDFNNGTDPVTGAISLIK